MADTSIFQIDNMDVDLKTYVKLRSKACLGDSVIYKFLVYNESSPVNLSDYKIEFRARLPKSGQIYSETDNITMTGNELTIVCDNVLTSEIGEVIITLRLVDIKTYKQKSNYIIILKVMSTIDADEEIQSASVLSSLESLDYAIDRYFELKVDLMDQITIGQDLLQKLINQNATVNTTIVNAQNMNTALNNTYNISYNLNNDLKNNINSANNLNAQVQQNISDLNSSIAVAKYYKNELQTTVTSAQVLDNDLKSENQWASDQIAILKQFGDINVLIKKINDLTTSQNDLSHLLDLMMESNPLHWVDDNGNDVLDDNGNIILI